MIENKAEDNEQDKNEEEVQEEEPFSSEFQEHTKDLDDKNFCKK